MPTEKADMYTLAELGDLTVFKSKFNLENINEKDEYGTGLLHYAIEGEQTEIALFLIDSGIDVNMVDEERKTALQYLCIHPNIQIAKAILEHGGDINIRDKYGNNALWTAVFNCKGRYYDMVELFMEYSPDVETKNNAGRSPLDFAIQVGNDKLIKMLAKNN